MDTQIEEIINSFLARKDERKIKCQQFAIKISSKGDCETAKIYIVNGATYEVSSAEDLYTKMIEIFLFFDEYPDFDRLLGTDNY